MPKARRCGALGYLVQIGGMRTALPRCSATTLVCGALERTIWAAGPSMLPSNGLLRCLDPILWL